MSMDGLLAMFFLIQKVDPTSNAGQKRTNWLAFGQLGCKRSMRDSERHRKLLENICLTLMFSMRESYQLAALE